MGRANIKPVPIRFGAEVEAILRRRPTSGPLFPNLRPGDRASEFRQRVMGLEHQRGDAAFVSLYLGRKGFEERLGLISKLWKIRSVQMLTTRC